MTERFRELTGETAEEAMVFLGSFRTLHMATASASGEPQASYAPFVRTCDNAFHICVSDLSRHTGHLVSTGRASVLIAEDGVGVGTALRPSPPGVRVRRRAGGARLRTLARDHGPLRAQVRRSDPAHPTACGFSDVRARTPSRGLRQGLRTGLPDRRSRARCARSGERRLRRTARPVCIQSRAASRARVRALGPMRPRTFHATIRSRTAESRQLPGVVGFPPSRVGIESGRGLVTASGEGQTRRALGSVRRDGYSKPHVALDPTQARRPSWSKHPSRHSPS